MDNTTKRPWAYGNRNGNTKGNKSGWGKIGFWGANDSFILGSEEGWDGGFEEPSKEDAALIVKSVNGYDDLVGILEDVREYFADCADADAEGDPMEFKPNKEMTILTEIEQALAKAKVES